MIVVGANVRVRMLCWEGGAKGEQPACREQEMAREL